jgi:hypothetical protein
VSVGSHASHEVVGSNLSTPTSFLLEDENNGTANNKRAAEARKIHFKREVDD